MTSENSGETPPASHHLHGGGNRQDQETLPCPRCNSGNTKFCYYNNYNLSQPRHFCKSCRRYWTRGGTLRNVPVGGGSRNKRPRTATTEDKPPVQIEKKVETSVTNSFFTDVDLNEMGKGCENGFDPFGNGSSGFEDLCFGEAGGSGLGDTWRGEYSFGWPDLAISSLGWGPKEC